MGTSLELADYAAWVRRQPLLASLGTPVWTTVQTQPNEALREQLLALEPGYAPPLSVSPEQIRLLAYTAVAAGSRGLVFASDSPLGRVRPRHAAAGNDARIAQPGTGIAGTLGGGGQLRRAGRSRSVPEVAGTVLRTEHSRLLLPLWSAPGAQCVPSQSAANALSLVAPGVPEASDAYELTPHGVQSLRHQRVAGGVRVTCPSSD